MLQRKNGATLARLMIRGGTPKRPKPETLGARCPIPETPTRRRSRRCGSWPTTSPPAASRAEHSASAPSTRSSASAAPTSRPPPYEPADGQPGSIRDLLEGMAAATAATPILDHGNTIGLKQGAASISLEPAGQLELSGAPLRDAARDRAPSSRRISSRSARSPRELGLGFAPLGFHPTATRAADAVDAQGPLRDHARATCRKVGTLGLDMMTRTCTVQVNLDYASEADMVRKLRVSLLLQPLATALFANSPFTEGQPNGFLSYRAHVWTDTDNERSGIPAVMFEHGFGFERYVEWLVDRRADVFRLSRRRAISMWPARRSATSWQGGCTTLPATVATVGDFADHMTTVFTDVRHQAVSGDARRRRRPRRT